MSKDNEGKLIPLFVPWPGRQRILPQSPFISYDSQIKHHGMNNLHFLLLETGSYAFKNSVVSLSIHNYDYFLMCNSPPKIHEGGKIPVVNSKSIK
jgi:hypothetical protein